MTGGILSAFLSFFFGIFGRLFLFFQTHFLATQIMFTILFITVLPVVLNNLMYSILEGLLNIMQSRIQTVGVDQSLFRVYQFGELGGWLLSVFRIPESFSIIVTAISVSFTLRSIPLVRW